MPKRQILLDPPKSTSGMIAEIPEALGQSDYFLEFRERLSRVAPINRPVLIVGERGTGKELAASRLHFLSKRWQGPLVTLNCSALTPSLIESELFGFEKGAFTGALERRKGRFESADGGTLFLDEIGKIPSEVQEKILRVVEYGSFERVGSSESIKVDVRIIAATNADLPALAEEGKFKKDLLDRLSFEVLTLPPLRKRGEDILILANHFAAHMAQELEWEEPPSFSEDATQALQSYQWPGNVRNLRTWWSGPSTGLILL
jgi:psp operon transcriptional activator